MAVTAAIARKIVKHEFAQGPRPQDELSLPAAVLIVRTLDRSLERLNERVGVAEPLEIILRETTLQCGFTAFVTYLHSSLELASNSLLATWSSSARRLSPLRNKLVHGLETPSLDEILPQFSEETFRSYLTTFNLAVAEILREHATEPRSQLLIRELLQRLNLSYDELGRVLSVSGETVRRWEKGTFSVPPQKLALLQRASFSLQRLLRLFKPESLSSVVRRPAKLFGGESALDWIRLGRIVEVADRYESNFAYQG
jgi:DNA-binding transcriptional regulator YiaG